MENTVQRNMALGYFTFVSPKSLESKSKCRHINPTVNNDLSNVGFLFG